MRTTVLVIAAIVSSLIAAGTVYQAYILLWRPELAGAPEYERRKWPRWRRAVLWGSMIAAFIGICYMIYKGVEGALWFIPKSWTHVNEDGEDEWVVHGIAFFIAFFGSMFVYGKLNDIAAEKAREFGRGVGRNVAEELRPGV